MQLELTFSSKHHNNRESDKFYTDHEPHFDSQNARVKRELDAGNRINCDSMREKYKIRDLRARIHYWRKRGIDIKDSWVKTNNSGYKEYYL